MSRLDVLVGVSVSTPPAGDLQARGVSEHHVQHCFIDLNRQILAAGGSVAYGGHLEESGYTGALLALLKTYSRDDRPATERVHQYLAQPIWEAMTPKQEADLAVLATVIRVDAPPSRPEARKAAAFRAMREHMAQDIDVRVVLGGRVAGQQGRWPGIIEEVALSIAAERPVFILGGMGGAAAGLAAAVRGYWPVELTDNYQRERTAGHDRLAAVGEGPEESELRDLLKGADLHNGLSRSDNDALMETADLDLMMALVLRGLWAADP